MTILATASGPSVLSNCWYSADRELTAGLTKRYPVDGAERRLLSMNTSCSGESDVTPQVSEGADCPPASPDTNMPGNVTIVRVVKAMKNRIGISNLSQ
jgi:hypothetical protein